MSVKAPILLNDEKAIAKKHIDVSSRSILHSELKKGILEWLGPKIRKRMEELGILQSDLAKMTGIGAATLSNYLTGQYEPSLSKVMALRYALKVDWAFFFEKDSWVRGRAITDGLVSYWTFDRADIDGETVRDIWGQSHGKIIGKPQIVTGKFGEAMKFGGATNYVEFDDSKMPFGNAPRSMSAWVKLEEIPAVYHFWSVVEWGTNAAHQRCGLLITWRGEAYFVSQVNDLQSQGVIELGEWNHIALTYDSETIRIYINGELDTEGAPGWGGKVFKLDTKLGIGRMGLNIRYREPFPGMIDEVSVYNRALSEDEVKQNYLALQEHLLW